jgi:hypothetical protein
MTDSDQDQFFLNEVRRSRIALEEQIKQGQLTIDKSKDLLKRLGEIIARADKNGSAPS